MLVKGPLALRGFWSCPFDLQMSNRWQTDILGTLLYISKARPSESRKFCGDSSHLNSCNLMMHRCAPLFTIITINSISGILFVCWNSCHPLPYARDELEFSNRQVMSTTWQIVEFINHNICVRQKILVLFLEFNEFLTRNPLLTRKLPELIPEFLVFLVHNNIYK